MAGLLSGLMSGQFTDDPEQNKLITQGLLNFGLNLMQSRGRLGQGIGQSGLAAIQGVNEYKQQQYREQLRKQQQEEYDRVKKQRGLEDQFRQNLVSPEMLASQNALAGGGGPTTENATKIQPVDPNEKFMYDAMRSGLMSPLDYIKMRQKDDSLIPVPEGGSLVTRSGVLKYNSPKAPKDDRTADQRDYAAAVAQGYKGSFID